AVGLGEQSKQLVEQLPKERILVECAAEVAGDLQDDLELVAGVLRVQRLIRRRGINRRADDRLFFGGGGQRIGLQGEDVGPDLNGVPRGQRDPAADAPSIDVGAVAAAKVL